MMFVFYVFFTGCASHECVALGEGDDRTGTPLLVTLGVYDKISEECFVDLDKDLEMVFGDACHTWSRLADAHDEYTEKHDHFNAARDMEYDQQSFTWFEYGPEHSQADIDVTCAAGEDGVEKTAYWSEYVQQPPKRGPWLRIKSVSYE